MCLGVALTGLLSVPRTPRWRVGDLHQFTGMIGLGLVCTHIAVLVGLRQQPFTLPELFIPFLRQINSAAPVLGITGLYVLVMVTVVSRARRYVGMRIWRMVHMFSFVGFALALAHAIVAGPDTAQVWAPAMYGLTVSILLTLTILRAQRTLKRAPFPRRRPNPHRSNLSPSSQVAERTDRLNERIASVP
jgi:methionine sulfoxide reductase heme-binding subunit